MTELTLRIPDKLEKQLLDYCREQDIPASDVVLDSLRRFLALQKFRALQRELAPRVKAKGFNTEEDIFRIVS